jgi:choline dehydrogenase-like flavoprotein
VLLRSDGRRVDHALRVRGIANLRIAEASIMPFIVNAYTDAPAIISGEKAAAMTLVATWQSRHERNSG